MVFLIIIFLILPVKYGGFLLPDVVARNISSLIPAVLHPPPVLAVVDQDQPLVPPHVQLLVALGGVVILGEHELGILPGPHLSVILQYVILKQIIGF